MAGKSHNPWLLPAAVDEPAAAAQAPGQTLVAATGPTAPQPGVSCPDAVDRLPRRPVPTTALLWWVGAHGGAGETTLVALLPGSQAAGHSWPVAEASMPSVLVARTSMRGLLAAQRAAADWASGGLPGTQLLGLVLVADAPGRLPRPLRDFAKVVAGGVPRVWHLPWCEPWRLGEEPTTDSAPRAAQALVADLRALLPNDPTKRG